MARSQSPEARNMVLAKILGSIVATRKDPRLEGRKLLVVAPVDPASGARKGTPLIAVDTVGAGFRETVLVVSGSSARMAQGCTDCPVDAAIVGIVDTVDLTG
jgi:microcompartment protein CcmK/EutM